MLFWLAGACLKKGQEDAGNKVVNALTLSINLLFLYLHVVCIVGTSCLLFDAGTVFLPNL
jgi:hypothetical protein